MRKETSYKHYFEWPTTKSFLNGQLSVAFAKTWSSDHSIKTNIKRNIQRPTQTQNQSICKLMNDICCLGGDNLHQLFPKKFTLPKDNGCCRCGKSCIKKNVFIVYIHACNKQVLKGELNPNPYRDSTHFNLSITYTQPH
jgi:hypothetical protein